MSEFRNRKCGCSAPNKNLPESQFSTFEIFFSTRFMRFSIFQCSMKFYIPGFLFLSDFFLENKAIFQVFPGCFMSFYFISNSFSINNLFQSIILVILPSVKIHYFRKALYHQTCSKWMIEGDKKKCDVFYLK